MGDPKPLRRTIRMVYEAIEAMASEWWKGYGEVIRRESSRLFDVLVPGICVLCGCS
jgi:hypothetical protein